MELVGADRGGGGSRDAGIEIVGQRGKGARVKGENTSLVKRDKRLDARGEEGGWLATASPSVHRCFPSYDMQPRVGSQ